jgi:hypothetical protein
MYIYEPNFDANSTIPQKGPVAERLGRALQKLVQRFESARDLNSKIKSP